MAKLLRLRLKDGLFATGMLRGLTGIERTATLKDPCVYCGGPSTTYDHIVPRAKGGRGPGNKARACRRCNHQKDSMSLLLFMVRGGLKLK